MRWELILVLACGCGGTTASTPSDIAPSPSSAPPAVDETCLGGSGASFVLADTSTNGLFVDADHLYTATLEGIVRVPRAGGPAERLVADDRSPKIAALDANALYYFGDFSERPALFSVPVAGGKRARLASEVLTVTTGAVDDATVTWTDGGGLLQIPIAGGTPKRVATLPTETLMMEFQPGPGAYFVAAYTVQIENHLDVGHGTIFTVPLAGGAPTAIFDGPRHVRSIALDGDRMYFIQERHFEQPGFISSARLDGSDVQTVVDAVDARSLVADAKALYFLTENAVMKVAKSGGTPTTIDATVQGPDNLHVYGGNLYWENAINIALSSTARHGIMTACK